MTLSMRERLNLQKSVKQSLATLRGGEAGMRERLALQKQVKADMAKLGGQIEAPSAPQDSAQYGEYLAWIQDAERTRTELEGDGFWREINADERLNDGEAARLLDEVQQRIKALSEPAPEAPAHERIKAAIQGGDASEAMRIAQTLTQKAELEETLLRAGLKTVKGSVSELLAYAWPQMQGKDNGTTAETDNATGQPDVSGFSARLTTEQSMDAPADWIIMNAPRPLLGHQTLEGGAFLSGRFYAAIDPKGDNAKNMVEQNRKLDARVVLVVAKEMQAEMALVGSKYAGQYRELAEKNGEPLHELEDIQNKIDDLRDKTVGELQALMGQVGGGEASEPEPESSEPESDPTPIPPTLTAQAVRGDFNSLALPEFIEQLKSAYSADEDLDGAKEAAIGYLEANQQELEAA